MRLGWHIFVSVFIIWLSISNCCIQIAVAKTYDTNAVREDDTDRIQVHIVPHSHDDSGWLKTVDQYFWGSRQDIQPAGIQYVLDAVVQSLRDNPDRRFSFAEMSFFTRWWAQQDDDMRSVVRNLVEEKRLNFINGGFVQHDEAAAHYVAMIDQTTRGHLFLKDTFDVAPTVGWQIDPFGHSSTQAGLLGASLGFDAFFFGRADYQDMNLRQEHKQLELIWRGTGDKSPTSGDGNGDGNNEIFTGNFASGNYGPPAGFWWEWSSTPDPPIADDPNLDEYNVEERIDLFVQRVMEVSNVTIGRDIMFTMGSDFHYANAHVWYKNMDKLIHYVNKDGRVHAFYSSPADYVVAKHSYDQTWPLKVDDFFPYADNPHSYWTGYFTSRPTSKGYIRSATSYLQAARQLEAYVFDEESAPPSTSSTDLLENAVATCQHHDAITGTAKQHVVNDYHKRIHRGLIEAQHVAIDAIRFLMGGGEKARKNAAAPSHRRLHAADMPNALHATNGNDGMLHVHGDDPSSSTVPHLFACMYSNISVCQPTVEMSRRGDSLFVVVYNSLAWSRVMPIRVPIVTESTCHWRVKGPDNEDIPSQIISLNPNTLMLHQISAYVNATDLSHSADSELVFMAEVLPLGYSSFIIEPEEEDEENDTTTTTTTTTTASTASTTTTAPITDEKTKSYTLSNDLMDVQFDPKTNLLSSITLKDSTTGVPLTTTSFAATYIVYNSSDGLDVQENRGQASGAYIFRDNGVHQRYGHFHHDMHDMLHADALNATGRVMLEIRQGDLVSEAYQVFDEWLTLVTRLYKDQQHIEIEWTVGPIPHEDMYGREISIQYTTSVQSNDIWYTDANGRAMIQRKRDDRSSWTLNVTEPIAGNYYPITAASFIRDEEMELAVLVDRAQGATSLKNGQLEFMLHRRLLVDDWRGVNEALNETMCGCSFCSCPGLIARGIHWISLSPLSDSGPARRKLQQLLNDPPLLFYGKSNSKTKKNHNSDHTIYNGVDNKEHSENSGMGGIRRSFSLTGGHIMHSTTHLLTLMRLRANRLLVRLAHIVDVDDYDSAGDKSGGDNGVDNMRSIERSRANSKKNEMSYTEDLGVLLGQFECEGGRVRETTLSGNQLKEESEKRRLVFDTGCTLRRGGCVHDKENVERGNGNGIKEKKRGKNVASLFNSSSWLVDLEPMEIRTFEIEC